eukprot:CAMPEP_0197845768 /NCGR_PEP_ID=MMETSP1438-20131217/2655_1 /TAXON_ID=1461541 /ORGANISM="Pterosperma sp., Strain CCMP1384" /LENGTH=120 /DNA_ID=CAMNT_0043457191 /DNA_START=68 /DNA_END=430 /DNA_ORIENTATION=+
MAAVASFSAVGVPALRARTNKVSSKAPRAVAVKRNLKMVCKAENQVQKTFTAVSTAATTALISASPAFALVDERLNGDGTGKPLGVSDPSLAVVLFGVTFAVWLAYYTAGLEGDKADTEL